MLEAAGKLNTWALDQAPVVGTCTVAERLPDHRIEYLDYEGPVSGERGQVTRWDWGCYEIIESFASRMSVRLFGMKLSCVAKIDRATVGGMQYVVTFLT